MSRAAPPRECPWWWSAAATRTASTPARKSHYSVQRGETLSSISRKFQCSTRTLAAANGIRAPRYNIRPGQQLKLEGCSAS